MSSTNKLRGDRAQKEVTELAALAGNNVCADCKARNPRWTSYNLGIFICVNCASIHRKIGTHITKVKSLTMDDWTAEQVEKMRSIGNVKSNSIYNPNELRNPPPANLEDSERDSEIEQYIRGKYQYRKFLDKSALVASKLGPSRSATSMTSSRSVSSPLSSLGATSAGAPTVAAAPASSITPRRPTTSSNSQLDDKNASQSRSVSQPISAPTRQDTKPSPLGGVWDDLSSLTNSGQNSSLPLQFQSASITQSAQPQAPFVNGAMGSNGYPIGVTQAGMGMNPFQPQQLGVNPFSQQLSQSPFAPQPFLSSPAPSQLQQQQTFNQQYMGASPAQPSPMMAQQHTAAPFFQPQPQSSSLQVQAPTQNYLSPSPNQGYMSAPPMQTQFLTPSPSLQFNSHSPQPQMMQQQPQSAMSAQGFMYQNPASAQSQMQTGFLGMTTMQMQQQQMLLQQQQQQQQQLQQQQQQQLQQQQQQQQLQSMFNPVQQPQMMNTHPSMNGMNSMYGGGGQVFAQGGFPTQVGGQQWGAM